MATIGNPHLHDARAAVAGMASFAGQGPPGTRCLDCIFADPRSRRRIKGELRGKCLKFTALMHFVGPSFPLYSASCHYFELAPETRVTSQDCGR